MADDSRARIAYALTMGSKLRGRIIDRAYSFAICPLLLCCPAAGAPQDSRPITPRERVIELELKNGWRFLLYPRHEAPTISFETFISVGAADDPAGMSGMANLVKNLLFKGSSRIGTRDWDAELPAIDAVDTAHSAWLAAIEGGTAQEISAAHTAFENARARASECVNPEEYSRIFEDAGSGNTLNAFADQDSTRFVVSLPSNRMELWCWMESERFRDPVFREFYSERAALLEDWHTRSVADTTGALREALRSAAHGDHPRGRPSRGKAEEIRLLDRASAQAFFVEHYGARDCVTTIAGDLNPDTLIPLLQLYFGSIPAGPRPVAATPASPKQEQERRVVVSAPGEPLLWVAWHVPPLAHPDSAAIEVAMRLLGYARSSRLERRLKRSASLASSLSVNHAWEGDRRAGLALIRCVPNIGVSVQSLEDAIYDEIQQLIENGPGKEELAGVKRVATADHYRSLRRNPTIAAELGSAWAKTGHWQSFFEREHRLRAVQAREVQRVLNDWFNAENRTVAIRRPPPDESVQPKDSGAKEQ